MQIDVQEVDAVRQFNRFYTRRIGVLPQGYLGSPYTLAEARVLYELAHCAPATATALGQALGLDPGYLSRLLASLKRRGLLQGRRSAHDARQSPLSLTDKGRKAFAGLNSRSREETAKMLSDLRHGARSRLVSAMCAIQDALEPTEQEIHLRAHRPGDLGWVVERHGALYYEEYGWDERFEGMVAGIVSGIVRNFDPARERCWIAERGGERLGSVCVVKQSPSVAKIRLLIVEPHARGTGLGTRLVEECVAFARAKGYRKLVLWTQSNLTAARAIYRKLGFRLVRTEPHRAFGPRVTGEYWEMKL